tara:strand:- start:44 stop:526 length:483 start_codon:yes stop_codon:yes gene_type:complete
MDDQKLLGILKNFVGEKTTFKKIANKIGMSSEILADKVIQLEKDGELKFLALGNGLIRIGEIKEKSVIEDAKLNSKPWIPSSSSSEALSKSRNYLQAQEGGETSKLIKEYAKSELYFNSYTNKKGNKKISINLNEELSKQLSENNQDVINAIVDGIKKEI